MKNKEFKYLLIGVLILAWGFFSYERKRKRAIEIAELENDLNRYVNGWIKYASIQKAIIENGKGWWISEQEFNRQPAIVKKCSLDPQCTWTGGNLGYIGAGLVASTFLTGPLGIIGGAGILLADKFNIFPNDNRSLMFAGVDTNERQPTIEDIKTAKIVLIGVTKGVSFHAELNKYPGRSLEGFWKLVNKNFFYLNRLKYLKKNAGYEGKRYSSSVIKELEGKYQDLTLNPATEILLNRKTVQQLPG